MARHTRLKQWLISNVGLAEDADSNSVNKAACAAVGSDRLSIKHMKELVAGDRLDLAAGIVPDWTGNETKATRGVTMNDLNNEMDKASNGSGNGTGSGTGGIRVKAPSERYSDTRLVAKHAKTGLPVHDERGKEVSTPSERTKAKAGVFLKKVAQRCGLSVEITEHERELLGEMLEKDTWCGKISENHSDAIPGLKVKALLGDSTSGGLEVVPVWFDTDIISFPLLYAELYPMVTITDVPLSNRVEGTRSARPR